MTQDSHASDDNTPRRRKKNRERRPNGQAPKALTDADALHRFRRLLAELIAQRIVAARAAQPASEDGDQP
jgi:hypothetical protein